MTYKGHYSNRNYMRRHELVCGRLNSQIDLTINFVARCHLSIVDTLSDTTWYKFDQIFKVFYSGDQTNHSNSVYVIRSCDCQASFILFLLLSIRYWYYLASSNNNNEYRAIRLCFISVFTWDIIYVIKIVYLAWYWVSFHLICSNIQQNVRFKFISVSTRYLNAFRIPRA